MTFLCHNVIVVVVTLLLLTRSVQCQPSTTPSTTPSSGPSMMIMTPSVFPSSTLVQGTASEIPSLSPILVDNASTLPSKVPVAIASPMAVETAAPVVVTTPVAAPVPATPVAAPVTTPVAAPSFQVTSDQCALNQACAALNLTGLCCPTIDAQFLYCCNGPIEPTCQRNPTCAALGLEGACCPTAGNIPSDLDGIYLDCCTAVPDECATTTPQSRRVGPDVNPDSNSTDSNSTDVPSSCVRMAAREYQEALSSQQQQSASSAVSLWLCSVMTATVVGTLSVTAVW